MVRKRFHLISIALLGLAFSPVSAASGATEVVPAHPFGQSSDGFLSAQKMISAQKVASADLGAALSPARSAISASAAGNQSVAQPARRLFDYPALVLLAVAIICMAALSRRDLQVGLKEGNG